MTDRMFIKLLAPQIDLRGKRACGAAEGASRKTQDCREPGEEIRPENTSDGPVAAL